MSAIDDMTVERLDTTTDFCVRVDGRTVDIIIPHDWLAAIARKAIANKRGVAAQTAWRTNGSKIIAKVMR